MHWIIKSMMHPFEKQVFHWSRGKINTKTVLSWSITERLINEAKKIIIKHQIKFYLCLVFTKYGFWVFNLIIVLESVVEGFVFFYINPIRPSRRKKKFRIFYKSNCNRIITNIARLSCLNWVRTTLVTDYCCTYFCSTCRA